MVRLVVIRHGESYSNVREFTFDVAVKRGHMTRQEADELQDQLRQQHDHNGDTSLTPNGEEQSRLLAKFYAPLLQRAARGEAGQLHLFNSPMLRNLQTLDPMMKEFASMGISITSEVRRDLHEVPGSASHIDRAAFRKVLETASAGRIELAEQLLKERSWKPAGYTPREIETMFPWARMQTEAFHSNEDVPWYTDGPETPRRALARMHRLAEWLEDLKDKLPSKDIVLIVSHGDKMSLMLNTIFTRAMIGKDAALKLQPGDPKLSFPCFPVANTAVQIVRWEKGGRPLIEAFQRLDHLGPGTEPDTLMRAFTFMGWLQPNKNDPVGYFGLKAPDAAQYFQRKHAGSRSLDTKSKL